MSENEVKPQVVSEGDVKMVGPGHDDSHYISVPIKSQFGGERTPPTRKDYTNSKKGIAPITRRAGNTK